jgi:hypothetical protein
MKKLISLILVVLLAMPAFAQYESNRKRSRFNHNDTEHYYGIRLGLNIASLSSETVEFDMDSRTGLAFGGIFGFQLANSTPLWLETGLFYSEKGGKTHVPYIVEGRTLEQTQKVTSRLCYLQAPVVVKYSFDVFDDFYIQPFLGGYLSLGVGGKTKYYGDRISESSFDSFTRFDGGLRLGCGAEYKMVYAELGFDFGLADINKGDFDAIHTRNFFVNVGVNF